MAGELISSGHMNQRLYEFCLMRINHAPLFHMPGGKTLLTPQPRLRTGFFSTLEAADLPAGVQIIEACTSAGAAKHGTPVGLDAPLRVDLIVIGSVAVDPSTGARLGKGEVLCPSVLFSFPLPSPINSSNPLCTRLHVLICKHQFVSSLRVPLPKTKFRSPAQRPFNAPTMQEGLCCC